MNFGFSRKQNKEIKIHNINSEKTTGLHKNASVNLNFARFKNILVVPQPGQSIPEVL